MVRAQSPQRYQFRIRSSPVMSRFLRIASAFVLLFALCSIHAFAQSQATAGQISGVVLDANGAAVANAKVKATNKETGLVRDVTASDAGIYTIVALPPGKYTVVAEATGFSNATIDDIVVNVGRTENINLTMGAAGVQATVLV